MTEETDEPEQSRKPFMVFLAVMILVLPVMYVLSSAPMLAVFGDGSLHAPQWWETGYAPVLWIEEKTDRTAFRTPILKWFELWEVDGDLIFRKHIRELKRSLERDLGIMNP